MSERSKPSSGKKEPSIISPRFVNALGGREATVTIKGQQFPLVEEGAYLWGVGNSEKGKGIFNHVVLAGRVAYSLAKALKEKGVPGYANLDLRHVVEAAVLHDVTKLYGEDREKLTPQQKRELKLRKGFREISDRVDTVGIGWLKELGFAPEVYEAIRGHDFPLLVVNDPIWKIVLVADYMVGQRVMTVDERLQDVRTRWIDERLARGEKPRISQLRFKRAQRNIKRVTDEIFGALQTTDQEFIASQDLNATEPADHWERFLRETREGGKDTEARRVVNAVMQNPTEEQKRFHPIATNVQRLARSVLGIVYR